MENISYLPPMGATKKGEYYRTIEMIEDIFKRHGKRDGVYYVLAFLYDSGYDRSDIKKMMDLCTPKKK